jgi:transposase
MTNIRWKKPNYIVENMTVKEVAALLDMTVQNVYQVIHRYGKDRIAEAIREKKSTQAL